MVPGWGRVEARVLRPRRWRIGFWLAPRGVAHHLPLQHAHELAICECCSPGQPFEGKGRASSWSAANSPLRRVWASAINGPAPGAGVGAGSGGVAGLAPRRRSGVGPAPGSAPLFPGRGTLQTDSTTAHAGPSRRFPSQPPGWNLRSGPNDAGRGWLQPHRPPDGGGGAWPSAAAGTRRLRDEVQHGALSPWPVGWPVPFGTVPEGPALTRNAAAGRSAAACCS